MASQAERQAEGLPCVESMLRSGVEYGDLQLEIDALADATAVLRRAPEVAPISASVVDLHKPRASAAHWRARLDNGAEVQAERVLLIPGAPPRPPPAALLAAARQAGVRNVHQDVLLGDEPQQLQHCYGLNPRHPAILLKVV